MPTRNWPQLRHLALLALVGAALLTALAGGARPAQAQGQPRCFAETGQCIDGAIRAYWERNGGLTVFGYPITAQRVETVEGRALQLQWFQRDRLEIQADGTVTAGRLGARMLELQWRPWQKFPPAGSLGSQCQFFPETGHSACGSFLTYWRSSGGLERFGYPVTEPMAETIEGREYTVQYYERRRMELHPELPGSPVLLGLLGTDVQRLTERQSALSYPGCIQSMSTVFQRAHSKLIFPEVLGCPVLYPPTDMPASSQQFENGEMIWFQPPDIRVPGGVLNPRIFAHIQPRDAVFPMFLSYDDTWREGDPDTPVVAPPAGRYAPWRGFGKVWAADQRLSQRIGWATEQQARPQRADYQIFEGGILVRVYEPGQPGVVYAFGDPRLPSQVQKVTP